MDAYLALLPMPARISARHALRVALVLLGEQSPSTDAVALALSLLNMSWARGRMPLANHLKRMRKATETNRFQEFTAHTPYLTAVADLDEASRAHEAQQTAARWVDTLFEDDRELSDIWRTATDRFAARLQLQPGDQENSAVLRKLLECLSSYRDLADDELDDSLAELPTARGTDPMVPRAFVLGRPGMHRGPAGLLQALMQSGAMTVVTRGPAGPTGAPEPQPSVTPEVIEGPKALVWSKGAALALLERSQGSPMDSNAKQLAVLRTMAAADGWRKLQQVPMGVDGSSALDDLYARFPHFNEVLDFVKTVLALAACGTEGSPVRIPPILLRGAPGTGKTFFAQELARVLELHFVERDLSVTTEAFVISGNDASWKGSKPGVVLDTLLHGKTANPLVLLNEVDKAIERGSHNSPIAPMYALLEPTSAAQFVDEFVTLPVDASHINWVLTANDGPIPAPILSRLEVFDIRQPTKEECRAIAASVWRSLLEKSLPAGHGFPAALPDDVLDQLAEISPRVMRKALTYAAGSAVAAGRRTLTSEDLSNSATRYAPKATRGMGFVQ